MAVGLEVTVAEDKKFFTGEELQVNDMLWKEKEGTTASIYWEINEKGVLHI